MFCQPPVRARGRARVGIGSDHDDHAEYGINMSFLAICSGYMVPYMVVTARNLLHKKKHCEVEDLRTF
jgi:hypothetical protein